MNPTLHITPQIIEFAARVRTQLADLPADEVNDLTEGLEADLTEAFAEDLARELPDPIEYALELRNAAGLPPQTSAPRAGVRQSLKGVTASIRVKGESVHARLRGTPLTSGILDMLIELRSAWWVLRAVVAYLLLSSMIDYEGPVLPQNFGQWVALGVVIAVSAQWGRGRWQRPWMSRLIIIGNVFAAIVMIPVFFNTAHQSFTWNEASAMFGYNSTDTPEPMAGVRLNDKAVTNIFAYGADGKALKGVQLFDQDGNPLATSVPGGDGCMENTPCVNHGGPEGAGLWVPSVLETGAKAWNVFPLQMQAARYDEDTDTLAADTAQQPQDRTPPFVKVPALMAVDQGGQTAAATDKVNKNTN